MGVDIQWTDAAGMFEDRFVVHLIIRSKPPRPRVMGTALGDARDSRGTAFVYFDRVLEVARGRNLEVSRLLAYAVAHEIGHLLLPYPSHSVAGIMHVDWSGDELRDIGARTFRFARAQESAIRARASQTKGMTASERDLLG